MLIASTVHIHCLLVLSWVLVDGTSCFWWWLLASLYFSDTGTATSKGCCFLLACSIFFPTSFILLSLLIQVKVISFVFCFPDHKNAEMVSCLVQPFVEENIFYYFPSHMMLIFSLTLLLAFFGRFICCNIHIVVITVFDVFFLFDLWFGWGRRRHDGGGCI